MIKYFTEAFKITNNNIILTTPLILFLLFMSIYHAVISNVTTNNLLILCGFITSIFLWSAFLSGWFYAIRQAILIDYEDISKEEKVKKSFSLLKSILKGVGEYFLPYVGFVVMFVVLFFIIMLLAGVIGKYLIGNISVSTSDFISVMNSQSQEAIDNFVKTVPIEDAVKLLKWTTLFFFISSLFVYITMFWAPEIFKNTKNFFKAFFKSNIFLWKNFLSTALLFIILNLLQFVVMIVGSLLAMNTVMAFFAYLIYFYFMVYVIIVVFLFYEKYEAKCNCNSRTDSIGQDQICDKSGEEN